MKERRREKEERYRIKERENEKGCKREVDQEVLTDTPSLTSHHTTPHSTSLQTQSPQQHNTTHTTP
jgi:hypothetical protein